MHRPYLFHTALSALLISMVPATHAGDLDLSLGLVSVRPDIDSPVVGAEATHELKPILNLTYYLNDHIALNTAAGITRHTFSVGGNRLGKASMAPFHLMLQYRFMQNTDFRPYIGAGIHRTLFFDQDGPVFETLKDFPSDTGGVLQFGFDYPLNKAYFLNFDVKKFYLKTDVLPGAGGGKLETIRLNPLLVGVAFGKRF